MSNSPRLTDRHALKLHRIRASRAPEHFLFDEVADDLKERLGLVNKTFMKPACVTPWNEVFAKIAPAATVLSDNPELGLEKGAHDLVIHAMALHWADDPVGQLIQSRLALSPDGLFLGVMFGGRTLHELRTALSEAETSLTGGLSPRVAPMADLRDLGGLLQRAGFALPVADSRIISVTYESLSALVRDLRGMGETNALFNRHKSIPPREFFQCAEDVYRKSFGQADGRLMATFELVYLAGWAPSDDQPKALRPGSATNRLSDALGVSETPAGDPIIPPKS